jgi:hypothetical protein
VDEPDRFIGRPQQGRQESVAMKPKEALKFAPGDLLTFL